MESGLFMTTRQQDQGACPEITKNPRDQMDAIHKKCKTFQLTVESSDSVIGEVVENHAEEPDSNFEEVKHQDWGEFDKELNSHKDAKGRNPSYIYSWSNGHIILIYYPKLFILEPIQ